MPLVMDKSKSKRGLRYQTSLLYLTGVQLDISDLPFAQNKDYQYSVSHLGTIPQTVYGSDVR